MSSFVLKWVLNRFLRDNQLTKLGVEDPYYEYIPVKTDKNGNVLKSKKVSRSIPEGISKNDLQVLHTVRKQAYRCDMWFNLVGFKFGWSNVVGLVPILGAIVSNFWSLQIYWHARKIDDGLPLDIQLIFFFNLLVDFALSLIPIVGDLVEIGYKANLRNFLLLEKHLIRVGKKNQGLISANEVRPGFLNDKVQPFIDEKVQPFVEETVVPGAVNVGVQIKNLVNSKLHSAHASLTTQSTDTTALGKVEVDDDAKSVHSLKETDKRARVD